MKKFYKKYINYIVILLFAFGLFKSCQSCSRESRLRWAEARYEAKMDSLQDIVTELSNDKMGLEDSINLLNERIGAERNANAILQEANRNQAEATKAIIRIKTSNKSNK